MPVDVVFTWVDGRDAAHVRKRTAHIPKGTRAFAAMDSTRFASAGEITYAVASVLRFAPFVRRIHIVTDGQDPGVLAALEGRFPSLRERLRVVDHREIFAGYEDALPTFSSRSIESMLWRIEGLAETFVYFNDDFILSGPVREEDWFLDGQPVLRGTVMSPPWLKMAGARLRQALFALRLRETRPLPVHTLAQWKAALVAGQRHRFFHNAHSPAPLRKSTFARFFADHPQVLAANIAHRFRDLRQFVPVALANNLELLAGEAHVALPDLTYIRPTAGSAAYLARKLAEAEANGTRFLCVQGLDRYAPRDQKTVTDWLARRIGLPTDAVTGGAGAANEQDRRADHGAQRGLLPAEMG